MSRNLDDKTVAEADALIADGQYIMAIKVVREYSGCDLFTAKKWVDERKAGGSATVPGTLEAAEPQKPSAMAQVDEQIHNGNLIEAIKIYREATGKGLRESKDFVDVRKKALTTTPPQVSKMKGAEVLAKVDQCLREGKLHDAFRLHAECFRLNEAETRQFLEDRKRALDSGNRKKSVANAPSPAHAPTPAPTRPAADQRAVAPPPSPARTAPHTEATVVTPAEQKKLDEEQAARFAGPKKSGCFGVLVIVAAGYLIWRWL